MSLIDIRNFVAPFKNKVVVGTIVVVGFLIFSVRWGTSGRDVVSVSTPSRKQEPRSLEDLQRDLLRDDDDTSRGGQQGDEQPTEHTQREVDDLLRGLIDDDETTAGPSHSNSASNADEASQPRSELQDLRRSLDLQ